MTPDSQPPTLGQEDGTGLDEIELAEEAHRLRLEQLLAEEEEDAFRADRVAKKVNESVLPDAPDTYRSGWGLSWRL